MHMGQGALDPRHDRVRGLDRQVVEVEAAEQYGLAFELRQHRAIEPGLRRLDRYLMNPRARQLWEERVAGRSLVDDRRVAEADVQRRRADDSFEGTVERTEPEVAGILGACMHVRLVDVHGVGPGRLKIRE